MTQQMPNPIPLYEKAAQGFRQTLAQVKPGDLTKATPCSQWNAQGLINHVIKTPDFVLGAIAENITNDPRSVEEPLPAGGAVAALDKGVAAVLTKIRTPGLLAQEFNSPFGRMPVGAFVMFPMLDLVIHRWDLATAIGQKVTLDPELVQVCLGISGPELMAGARAAGAAGPEVPVPASASPQDKLLGIWGRKPQG